MVEYRHGWLSCPPESLYRAYGSPFSMYILFKKLCTAFFTHSQLPARGNRQNPFFSKHVSHSTGTGLFPAPSCFWFPFLTLCPLPPITRRAAETPLGSKKGRPVISDRTPFWRRWWESNPRAYSRDLKHFECSLLRPLEYISLLAVLHSVQFIIAKFRSLSTHSIRTGVVCGWGWGRRGYPRGGGG